jgi:hypothetical protein
MIGVEDLMASDSFPVLLLSTRLRRKRGNEDRSTAHATAATTRKLAR